MRNHKPMKNITISIRDDQAEFLDEMTKVSRINKSEIIRQCLDRAAPDLMGALEAMKKHGFRPATKAERMKAKKKKPTAKKTSKARSAAEKKWDQL